MFSVQPITPFDIQISRISNAERLSKADDARAFQDLEQIFIKQLLSEMTLLVHAARQEPLGRVLLEAAASGCAIVATKVGGTEEIFPPQSNAACLIKPEDPDALARAIINILGDETLRNELGRAARRRAEAAFDVDRAAAGLAEHYRELIQ